MTESALPKLDELEARIGETLLADRRRLRKSFSGIRRLQRENRPFDRSLSRFLSDLDRAEQRIQQRVSRWPKIEYDPELPITARKDEIIAALQSRQVIVVCGETGSGKSTQLPKICLEAGRGRTGLIGHTQPRRIAARAVAARVADELGTSGSDSVAFKIRFTDTTSPRTLIKLMTDGILLAETQSDRLLEQYDTIIIDEAHERSLNIDFLLGYLKRLLSQRSDLRVIITSATIDAERFAEFFGDENGPAPVIEVSGRTYPVEIRYAPPLGEDGDETEIDWQRAIADACEELALEGPGDMLVFMPTERDIRETAKVLRGRPFGQDRNVEIVPLFGRLSEKEQNRVFEKHSGRRIVIATNVAESSLTVPGIRFVIDSGTARIHRFSATSQVQRLPIEPISQASANQRAGRCGRIGPGICVRLYSAEDYASRDEYTPPEILRTNLASVLLQMNALQLGRIEDFPFLDSPGATAVRSGLKTLFELHAIDEHEQLTADGKAMARLPVDPRIGRMILTAADEQSLEEVLIIASALELRDPRDRPLERQQAADTAHEQFRDERSDFLSLLKLWDFYRQLDKKLSTSKLRKACQQSFLSYNRMREWKDLHRQLREIVIDHGYKPTPRRDHEDAIHRAILAGLLSNVAYRGDGHEYTGAGGQKLYLWPGSMAFAARPKWIMAAELVETSRRFGRTVGPIQPQWIESLAGHLVKRTYSDPHWSSKSAAVMAYEKVLLFGMPVVPRRQCRYGNIDPKLCRELFIQHALIEGDFETSGSFFRHNAQLKEELADWQAKLRQGGSFVGEMAEFEFYDQRIPAEVVDGPRFEKWRKQAELKHPRLLFMSRDDLMVDPECAPREAAFPDQLRIGTMQLPVEYHLEPGAEEDGVTIEIPPEGLNQLSDQRLEWLVPGLLEEKVAALIKTLPKSLRILFVPVPETAAAVTGNIEFGTGSLLDQLSAALRRHSGEYVPVSAFNLSRLPDHLRMNIRVVDAGGESLASGRDLKQLQAQARQESAQAVKNVSDKRWHRDNIRGWDFGELPEQIELDRNGVTVIGYPMLLETDQSISLRLSDSLPVATARTRSALVRLFLMSEEKRLRDQVRHFPRIDVLTVQAVGLPGGDQLQHQLTWRLAEMALFRAAALPRTPAEWDSRVKQARNTISIAVQDLTTLLEPLLREANQVRRLLEQKHPPAVQPLIDELRQQFACLVEPGFLMNVPFPWLQQFPRYFQGMQMRYEKATTGGFQKDRKHQQTLDPYWRRFLQRRELLGDAWRDDPYLVSYRFVVEEFRISLFAQALKTAVPVSEKRLNEAWSSVR